MTLIDVIFGIAEWCREDPSSGKVDRIRVKADRCGRPRTLDQHREG
jgi:hypothetical protein